MDLKDNPKLREILDIIKLHEKDDPAVFALKHADRNDLPVLEIAAQLAARRKAKDKLPLLYQNDELWFPPPVSLEQSSSEATALYKASLLTGATFADLTGGFGIDCYFLSSGFNSTTYIERQDYLCEIARYNFEQLGAKISVINETAESYLSKLTEKVDCLYLDPARRDQNKQRVFRWEDCQPNIIELLPKLLEKADSILVKAAPMLDISKAVADLLQHVKAVHIVEWQGEVKELLFLIDKHKIPNPTVYATQIGADGKIEDRMQFTKTGHEKLSAPISLPKKYLYEPSPALMKSGFFNSIAEKYQLTKLHPNTQLFTADELKEGFMGKVYKVKAICNSQKKALKKLLPDGRANLKTRNFPMPVNQLKKKLSITDGGSDYLFACTLVDERKALLVCEKVND